MQMLLRLLEFMIQVRSNSISSMTRHAQSISVVVK
jgi:hypothetical protein